MIKIYSTPACPYCETLKAWLSDNGFEFEYIDVSADEKGRDEMVKKTGSLEVPIVDIDGQIVVGFDKNKISKILNIKD